VTSEEAGKEKPHPFIFHLALEKLKIQKYDVCMIGDSYSKDIVGAINLEIKSIWLNRTNEKREYDPNLVVEVNEFHNILNLV
jgi:putative hydrolase of the HAD superfamily